MRQVELSRLSKEIRTMKDGMYYIEFAGVAGAGGGCLVFESGAVFGADTGGGKYDGKYQFNENTGLVDLSLKVIMAANSQSVLGPSHPYEWSLNVKTEMDPNKDSGPLLVKTILGTKPGPVLRASYEFVRSLPKAA